MKLKLEKSKKFKKNKPVKSNVIFFSSSFLYFKVKSKNIMNNEGITKIPVTFVPTANPKANVEKKRVIKLFLFK